MTASMHWARWGDPDRAQPLPGAVRELLQQALGTPAQDTPPVPFDDVRVPASGLPDAFLAAARQTLGAGHARLDDEARIRHTRGKSTPDLLRMRAGDAADAPDAVLLPGTHDEVAAVVELCSQHRVALVPFGGGTSVVGGLSARRDGYTGVVAVDLCRLDRLVSVDPESSTAVLEAGLPLRDAERRLAEHGRTLGHFPQSFEYVTVGGAAATRSSGQASAGYGRFDAMVEGLRVATPVGTLELGTAPANAAGPDLRQLVLGSEGAFGVITAVTVRVRRRPEATTHEAWRFGTFAQGVEALRRLAQAGVTPTVLRLSDEAETAVGLAKPGELASDHGAEDPAGGCLLVTGYAGDPGAVRCTHGAATAVLEAAGGQPLGPEQAEGWARGRFDGPYLRDSLLDAGALAETLETATFWSRVPLVYDRVRDALTSALAAQGTPPLVLCHVSHVYPTGASLYFTVVAKQARDPVAQWQRAKAAATDTMVAAGATITHHHAVGRDHLPWLADEVGPVGVQVLRAVKERLDPAGVLNPGVLVP